MTISIEILKCRAFGFMNINLANKIIAVNTALQIVDQA